MCREISGAWGELLGCMIGLARTCSTNPTTDETEGLLLAGLAALRQDAVFTEAQVRRLAERVRADKALVSPNCVTCQSRCGRNDDYDVERIHAAPEDVRRVKLRIIDLLTRRGRVDQLVFDSLFALAEDWEAPALSWYADELEKTALSAKKM